MKTIPTTPTESSTSSIRRSKFNMLLTLPLLLASTGSAFAATSYVWQDGPSPEPPYTNWATAARVIQDAVDAAAPGDEIIVTNGTYATGGRAVGTNLLVNRVAVDKLLTLRGVNGPQFTIIQGHQVPGTTNGDGAIRCVYLANGASLSGFTLTNGATRDVVEDWPYYSESSGGGVWSAFAAAGAAVSNCVVVGNSAYYAGGGAFRGTLNNCTLAGNSAGGGGGACESMLNNCALTGNSAYSNGGGAVRGTLNNCTLTGNSARGYGGGAYGGTLNNCTLTGNSAFCGGGAAGTMGVCSLNDCTVTGNSAAYGGGVWFNATLNNCIVYFNTAADGPNYWSYGSIPFNYCCTTPLPINGIANITNAPLFVDAAAGNYRLRSDSPCINAGFNPYTPAPTDLDGRPRIVGGTVDIGAYEFQAPVPGSWTQRTDMPAPSSTPASCVVDGILYVIGGHYPYATRLQTVFAYDPQTDSWTRQADMPTARRFLAAAAVDGIIYVIGGGGAGEFPGVPLKTVEAYNPKTDTWAAKADMPTARSLLAACTVDGIIYAIGGGYDFWTPYSRVEAYDPKTNQWSRKRDLPKPLVWLTASVANGQIYTFVATEPVAEHPSETFAYDPTTDHWMAKAQFSPWAMGLASSTVDGIIYLFGGMTSTYGGHDFVLAYDPALDRFTARRKMPRTRMTPACGAIAGKIYLAGGVSKDPLVYSDAVYYKNLDVFDPQGGVMPQILSLTYESTNRVRLVWQGEAGILYGVKSAPDVAKGPWTRVTFSTGTNSVLATNSLVEATCLVPTPNTNRFFRVLEP